MKKHIHFAAAILAGLAILGGQQAQAQIAVKGETVYTMAGTPIKNGVVLLKDGKIEAVGANLPVPQNYTVYIAKVVTPGLVDAHATVGLAGIYNIPADQQQLEKTAPIQPELRALDAYNPQEELVTWVRDHGVTTINTGHGPGALISAHAAHTAQSHSVSPPEYPPWQVWPPSQTTCSCCRRLPGPWLGEV